MGLFQSAYETYDNNESRIGIYDEGHEPLAPVGHIVTSASIVVTIDVDGNYISSEIRGKKEPKIIIPVTESSAGRSGTKLPPHPLCEQVKYLASYNEKSRADKEAYLSQLADWIASAYSNPKIEAVYRYVQSETILEDLERDGTLTMEKGRPKDEKALVAWEVFGTGSCSKVWEDTELMRQYTEYYLDKISTRDKGICSVTGEELPTAQQHLKGVFSLKGNAKLISSNDSTNFTYRGRFNTPEEALTISYIASQKAHNALKWLVSNEARIIGERAFLCWSPQGGRSLSITEPVVIDVLGMDEPAPQTSYDYKLQLNKALMSYRSSLQQHLSETGNVSSIEYSRTVVASFDAATTGRLALTMYTELPTEEFLRRLERWDSSCVWYAARGKVRPFSLPRIAEFAFGTERDPNGFGRMESETQVKRQVVERLVHCRLGEELFPQDIKRRLVQNASNPVKYGSESKRTMLNVACAAIRKYHIDHDKEDVGMDLDKDRLDRSYQFGRLLAVYEKIERDTYDAQDGKRDPNAMRIQSVYCNQPLHYACELDRQMVRAYFPRLSTGAQIYYKNLIEEIMAVIYQFPEKSWNQPLGDTYLIGYYLQRMNLYTKKASEEED